MGDSEEHHKFFKIFEAEETRINFDENPANQSFQNSQKSLLEAEKCDFSPNSHSIRPISWKRVKMMYKHIF